MPLLCIYLFYNNAIRWYNISRYAIIVVIYLRTSWHIPHCDPITWKLRDPGFFSFLCRRLVDISHSLTDSVNFANILWSQFCDMFAAFRVKNHTVDLNAKYFVIGIVILKQKFFRIFYNCIHTWRWKINLERKNFCSQLILTAWRCKYLYSYYCSTQ